MNIKTVMIDDDPAFLSIIRKEVESISVELDFEVEIICYTTVPKDISKIKADIFFLDVEMPDVNGLELCNLIDPQSKAVIVTAHDEFVTDSFMYHPYSFVSKGYLHRDLRKVMRRYYRERQAVLKVSINREEHVLPINDIVKITVQRNNLVIHMVDQEISIYSSIRRFMKKHKTELLERFAQINPGEVVNLDYVYWNANETMYFNSAADEPLDITEKYKDTFRNQYILYKNRI